MDGEALLFGIECWSFWYRPRLEGSTDFEAEVVVQPSRLMPLDDKSLAFYGLRVGAGFGVLAKSRLRE